MKRLVKVALGFTTLATFGNVAAETSNMDVGLTALVSSSCNTADAFVNDQDLSTQITDTGAVLNTAIPLPITSGAVISCNVGGFNSTTLNMVSLNKGIKNGPVVLPYIISGNFGSIYTAGVPDDPATPGDESVVATTVALTDAQVTDFDSGVGPATNLLATSCNTPASTPAMQVLLKPQADGTAKAGNYADTLTLTVIVL